jgi:long-chain-fatty-acid--CoA ligase ACSBG
VATGSLAEVHNIVLQVILPLFVVAVSKMPFVTFFPKLESGIAGPCPQGAALINICRSFRPTVFFGSQALFLELWAVVKSSERQLSASDQKLRVWAANVMRDASYARQTAGGANAASLPKGLQLAQSMADKVLSSLGLDCAALFVCVGGPCPHMMLEELAGAGIDVHEVFAAAETTGICTASSENRFLFGACGVRAQGTQIQIDGGDEGQVVFRGRHVMMGYLRHLLGGGEKQLFSTGIDASGWLRLGDIGYFNETGFLSISGRTRDTITSSSGDRIQPNAVERAVKKISSALSNVVVIGDKRRFLVCLLTLKCIRNQETGQPTDELAGEALLVNPETLTVSAARKDEKWLKYVATVIAEVNGASAHPSHKIKRFCILPVDFSILNGELTASGKARRHVVAAKYSSLIEKLYADDGSATPRK